MKKQKPAKAKSDPFDRAGFEAWLELRCGDVAEREKYGGGYVAGWVQNRWIGWKSAHESLRRKSRAKGGA